MTVLDTDEAIARVGRGLIDRTLPKPEWTHEAHFAAALWLLRCRPRIDPASGLPPIIRAYNEATGVANTDTGGYHETITQASLGAARAMLSGHPADAPIHRVLRALMASPFGRSGWPLEYWSKDRLFSAAARRGWVEPDVKALPFPLLKRGPESA